jgi:uncharacterized protein
MGRIVFFVLLALAIYVGWRLFQAKQLARKRGDANAPRLPMVSCATCGLHVPRNEALRQDDRFYCCEEHRGAGS